MRQFTICFPVRKQPQGQQILLGIKAKKIAIGKFNGYGGGIEAGETKEEATCRELREEVGLLAEPGDVEIVAHVIFSFDGEPMCDCFISIVKTFEGEPRETSEMLSPSWFDFDQLPLDRMMAGDRLWIPRILAGELLEGTIDYVAATQEVRTCELEAVSEFNLNRP